VIASTHWDERIARARQLAGRHPEAADVLTFLAGLGGAQRQLADRWAPAMAQRPRPASLRESLDADLLLGAVPDLLSCLERIGPAGLAAAVADMRHVDAAHWKARLDEHLVGGGAEPTDEAPQRFVIEALLQPMAQLLALRFDLGPGVAGPANRCAFCDCLPVVGVLREEGHGAKRTLFCGRCLREWAFPRVVCPACGERTFDKLPVYTADRFSAARIDGCETCRAYLKTIDASKDGLAIPVVDDIATVALDLWAREQGYVRLRENLLRT
jgi:FdhE protein